MLFLISTCEQYSDFKNIPSHSLPSILSCNKRLFAICLKKYWSFPVNIVLCSTFVRNKLWYAYEFSWIDKNTCHMHYSPAQSAFMLMLIIVIVIPYFVISVHQMKCLYTTHYFQRYIIELSTLKGKNKICLFC